MEFKLLSAEEKKEHKEQIFALLAAADGDFVPPISKRNVNPETNRNTFSENGSEKNLRDYCDGTLREEMMGIFEEGELCGFVSFAKDLVYESVPEISLPNIYIGTAVISSALRGRGTLTAAYEYLFNTLFADLCIFTRTWSTNAAHIRVLEKFEFEKIKTLPNHRGYGIDTIYFGLRR